MKWPRRKCLICRDWFHPKFSNEWWCCPEHGAELAIKRRSREREKAEAKLRKEQQQKEREAKDKLKISKLAVKPTSYFRQQAQTAFNQFIRLRDRDEPCISCGEPNPPDLHGGSGTAVIFCLSGHILSCGLRSEMPISNVNHAMRGPVNSHTKITL